MKGALIFSVTIQLIISATLVRANTPAYTITDLGTLGGTYSSAFGINENGQIVGASTIAGDSIEHAFYYDRTSMYDLGTLGGTFSTAFAINSSGNIAGYSGDPEDISHAFYYDGTTLQDLGIGAAYDINDDGQVVGNSNGHAFLYDGTIMHDLEAIIDNANNSHGINNNGQLVVSTNNKGIVNSFIYEAPEIYTLGTLGGLHSTTLDINNKGQIVGYSTISTGQEHAFLYDNSTLYNLGTLAGNTHSEAWAINDNGQVVGSSYTYGQIGYLFHHAFIYNEDEGMVDLNNLIPPESGWILTAANDINSSGQIVGSGKINGETHAFLITPIDDTRPVADAEKDQTVYAWIEGYALVQLDGTGSYDPEGDALEYFWYDANELIATGAEPNVSLPVGEHVIDLIVNDGTEDSEPNSCVVTVLPAIEMEAKLTPQALNHKSNQPHVIGRLELPGYSVDDIDPNAMMVLVPGNIVADRVAILPVKGKKDSITLMGFFNHAALMDAITEDCHVEVQIAAKLISGQWVYGTDTIRIH